MIDESLLVRVFGFKATLFHHDTTVLDRWLWLKKKLPITKDKETLIDMGCGTGSYCTGFFSQKITGLHRFLMELNPMLAWLIILPLRFIPLMLDKLISKIFNWPGYSICMETYKPRR